MEITIETIAYCFKNNDLLSFAPSQNFFLAESQGRMLKSKNLKMGTSSKAQFTLTVRTISVYIVKANVLMGILFILLY